MKLSLFLPVKPKIINQNFGANYDYYFSHFGTKGHMGLDFGASHGQPVYAPCDGVARYLADNHGGDGFYITTQKFAYGAVQVPFNIVLWHLCSKDDPDFKPLIPTDGVGTNVKAGQLIAYADNTGAPFESSGDHLHFGLIPLKEDGTALEPNNGFNGCIDPTPYFSDLFAENIQLQEEAIEVAQKAVALVQANKDSADNNVLFKLLSAAGNLLTKIFGS